MANYFSQVPNFDYVSRIDSGKNISDYIQVKNLFKRGKIREDIFQNLAFFEKYNIQGDDRPDTVASKVYGDSNLDWVILLCNNIINIQSEWPLPQTGFDEFLLQKYGDYDTLYNGVHHYETREVRSGNGAIIVPKGLQVPSTYSVSYYDYESDNQVSTGNISEPITNYQYEEKIENDKRNIFILKQRYLNIITDDMGDIMPYREGSSQYVTETLKRGENIRLYS
jgi:hypothetical protein